MLGILKKWIKKFDPTWPWSLAVKLWPRDLPPKGVLRGMQEMFFKDKKWYHLRNIRIDLEVSLDFVTERDFSPNFYGSLKFNLTVYISSQFPNTLLGNKLLRMKYFCSRNQMIILLRFVLPSDWSANKNDRYFQESSHFRHDILFLSIRWSIFIQTKFNFGMDSRLHFDHVVKIG